MGRHRQYTEHAELSPEEYRRAAAAERARRCYARRAAAKKVAAITQQILTLQQTLATLSPVVASPGTSSPMDLLVST
jgi:hypothetical protein